MAEITNKFYRGEPLRATIYFDSETEYQITTAADENGNSIVSAEFNYNEGNNNANNILGINTPNKLSLKLYDSSNNLSPSNSESPYFNKIDINLKIKLEISYDGLTWSPFGDWYVDDWKSNFLYNGAGYTNISCSDKLSQISDMQIPTMRVYNNVQATAVIASLFEALGWNSNEYNIDSRLNFELPYGVAQGDKIRDTLNNICQIILARIIVDREGIVRVVPALLAYQNSNNITLGPDDIADEINTEFNAGMFYKDVNIKYLSTTGEKESYELYKGTKSLAKGTNNLDVIKFNEKCISVENVHITYENEGNGKINSMHYNAYMDGIALTLVTSDVIDEASIYVEGKIYKTNEEVYNKVIDDSIDAGTFNFDTQQILDNLSAAIIGNKIASYVTSMKKIINLSANNLSPKLFTGDTVTITNTDTIYDGVYKIINLSIKFSEGYSTSLKLIKLS